MASPGMAQRTNENPASPNAVATDDAQTTTPKQMAETLGVEGFVYLDASGVPVLRPDMTLETYEQLRRLQDGMQTASQTHVNVSLTAKGQVTPGRATFNVEMNLRVAATDGRWISTPIRMVNFHPTDEFQITSVPLTQDGRADDEESKPTDERTGKDSLVDGDVGDDADGELPSRETRPADESVLNASDAVDEHLITLSPDSSGYVLSSRTSQPCQLRLQFEASARVSDAGFQKQLVFELPDVSSAVEVVVPQTGLSTDLIGSGDEVLTTTERDDKTVVSIESIGGQFTLRWTAKNQRPGAEVLLNSSAIGEMVWSDPNDQPILSTELDVQNLRGDVPSFKVEIPEGAILLSSPTLQTASSDVDVRASDDPEDRVIDVRIAEGSRLNRVVLLIDLQLKNDASSSSQPLAVQLPRVLESKRQTGLLTITSSEDYRLRWLDPVFVQSIAVAASNPSSTRRSHSFQFDRGEAQLPVWLAAKKRQLRLATDVELTLHDSAISMNMTVRPNGQIIDGRGLKIDLTDWRVRAIQELETGNPIDPYGEGPIREIELVQDQTTNLVAIQIIADHILDPNASSVDAILPRIVETDDSVLVSQAYLKVASGGRRSLVVDSSRSVGLERVQDSDSMTNGSRTNPLNTTSIGGETWKQYRIVPSAEPTRLAATMIDQPQSVTLLSDMKVQLDQDRIITTIDWPIKGQFDFEGRLPIRMIGPANVLGIDQRTEASPSASTPAASTQMEYSVSVDGVAASFRPVRGEGRRDATPATENTEPGDDSTRSKRYEIISDRLNSGARAIRFQFTQPIDASGDPNQPAIALPMPQPDTSEVILRGAMQVVLLGDASGDLVAVEQGGKTQLNFNSLPRRPIRVERRAKAQNLDQTIVRRAVIRTRLGTDVRHEQIHAVVDGGTSLSVVLPMTIDSMTALATVNGRTVNPIRRGDRLEIPLENESLAQSVQLKAWFPVSQRGWSQNVEPMVQLAGGVEQVYWQLVTPQSQHVLWASPTIGRAMSWRFDRWRLTRRPTMTSAELSEWLDNDDLQTVQVGNEYLYLGTSAPAFTAVVLNRSLLWLLVGSAVLICAGLLMYVPATRHPVFAIVASLALSGLLLIAPDAAVLAGQWMLVALLIVVITLSLHSLMSRRRGSRVLTNTSGATRNQSSSTHEYRQSSPSGAGISRTKSREVDHDSENAIKTDARSSPDQPPPTDRGPARRSVDPETPAKSGSSLSRTQSIMGNQDSAERA